MSYHVSRILIKSVIKQKAWFPLKKGLLTFRTTWAKSLLSLAGSPIRGRVKDAKEDPWPTMRMTPATPEKAKKSGKGGAALSGYSLADGYEALLGLLIFADLFDNVAGCIVLGRKRMVCCSIPASEKRHLIGKEGKKKAFQRTMLSYA